MTDPLFPSVLVMLCSPFFHFSKQKVFNLYFLQFLNERKTFSFETKTEGFHKIWKQKCASVLFTYVSPLSSKVRVMLGGIHKLLLQVLTFFGHLPPSAYIFYGKKVYKKTIVLTTYPPPLVNVVCERPLRLKLS